MTDIRLPASGNIKARWHVANAFADPAKPTAAEVNAGLKLENAISWNDFDFGVKASNTNNDPALSAKSNTADRGASQYNGGISFYLPLDPTDTSNEYATVINALDQPRTLGWLSFQIDGELSETNTPTYSGGIVQTAAVGDFISIFKVMTGGYSNAITGEDAFRETISFLPQGEMYLNAVVATTNVVDVTPATATVAIGAHAALKATLNGREYTRGVRWSSADSTKVTVSQNGIVSRSASGAVVITATFKGVTDTATIS